MVFIAISFLFTYYKIYLFLIKIYNTNTMQITINNTEYNVKYTIRALFIFEQITGKPFEIKTLLDNYVFFYSMVLANNENNILSWDDFIDAIDNDANLVEQLNNIVNDYQKKDNLFDDTTDTDDTVKKN